MNKKNTICKICSNEEESELIPIKEMMFGTNDIFFYFTCNKCGCLQINNPPENIANYYPENYYSFHQKPFIKNNIISKFISYHRTRYILFGNNLFGNLLSKIHPNTVLEIIGSTGININSKVLDVGCGTGHILYMLSLSGMKYLLGIDPYINKNIEYENGLKIMKNQISEIEGGWDLIMMHHVLEHMQNQIETLEKIKEKLNPEGKCLVRIPTCSGDAWKIFKNNWVQADAPRHFFLHSLESIEVLAKKTGFLIEKVIFDSSAFQFWGSIQYSKNIPLMSEKSYLINPKNSIFTKKEIQEYHKKAIELNRTSKGDQVSILLRKIN